VETASISLTQQVQRELALLQIKRLGSFDVRTLAWLALPPGWTVELANSCSFPAGEEGLAGFLKNAEQAGVLQIQKAEGEEYTDFWVPPAERPGLIDWIKQKLTLSALQDIVFDIGTAMEEGCLSPDELSKSPGAIEQIRSAVKSIASAVPVKVKIPANIRRWSRLAARMNDPFETADWLDNYIVELLDKHQSGEAISWLEAARPLVELLGGPLETAVRLGSRRLELSYRREYDKQQLVDFYEREEQIQPFNDLLESTNNWALHYLGIGGVGKTSLLRFISAGCPDSKYKKPIPYVSCTVDFDYINPDFPYKKPGQLLLELAAELRLYGVSVASLRKFSADVESFHALLVGRIPGVTDLASLVKKDSELADQFQRMLKRFYSLVLEAASAEHDRIVVIVLDTCEELTKVPSPEGRQVAVEATYFLLESLEELHRKSSTGKPMPFRVIFSGRRLLAQSGYQWKIKKGEVSSKHLMLPKEKKYLALHELRGFDHRELKEFYREEKKLPAIPRQAYKAILRSSQESGRSIPVEIKRESYAPRLYRYNPFDLDLFADWIISAPDLSPQEIASGREDPYIEYRILKRLHADTQELLPHVVLLEQVDGNFLRLLCQALGKNNFEFIYRELIDQDWTDYHTLDQQQISFLELNTKLLPRLQRYYGLQRGAARKDDNELSECTRQRTERIPPDRLEQRQKAQALLDSLLTDLILGRNGMNPIALNMLSAHYIDVALRLLPLKKGALIWEAVERRISTELGWAAAGRFLDGILAEETEKENSNHPLLAGTRAAQISVLIHTKPGTNRSGSWQEVAKNANQYPTKTGRERLVLRSLFGRLAAVDFHTDPAELLHRTEARWFLSRAFTALERMPLLSDRDAPDSEALSIDSQQIVASACAALANFLDMVEYSMSKGKKTPILDVSLDVLLKLEASLEKSYLHLNLKAWAHGIIGRFFHVLGDQETAWNILREAVNQVADDLEEQDRDVWLDWAPPYNLRAHLAMHALRALPVMLNAGQEKDLLRWRHAAIPKTRSWNVDSERMLSASLTTELGYHTVDPESIDLIRMAWDGNCFEAGCFVHEQTPSLILALARSYLALAQGQKAIDLLSRQAESTKDSLIVQAARQGYLECLRRLRIRSSAPWIEKWVKGRDVGRAVFAWNAEYLNGGLDLKGLKELLPQKPSPAWMLLWNQLQRNKEDLIYPSEMNLRDNAWRIPSSVGYEEARLAFARFEQGTRFLNTSIIKILDCDSWLLEHPGQIESALRLGLQVSSFEVSMLTGLSTSPDMIESLLSELIQQVPVRRRAEIALEEGELYALRNPLAGQQLLALAGKWFREAGDGFGALQSSICILLAKVRLREKRRSIEECVVALVRPDYEMCRKQFPDLPAWERIFEGSVALTGRNELKDLLGSSSDWAGWIRYLLAVRYSTEPERISRIGLLMLDITGPYWPPEIDFQPVPAPRDRINPLWYVFSVVLTLVVLGLLLLLLGKLMLYLLEGFGTLLEFVGIHTGSRYLVITSFIAVLAFCAWVIYRLRCKWKSYGRLDLAIDSARDRPGFSLSLQRQSLGLHLRLPFLYWKKTTWRWQSKGLEKVEGGKSRPEGFSQARNHLVGLFSNPAVRNMPFAIDSCEQGYQTPPWEQIWAYALGQKDPLQVLKKLAVHRTVNGPESGALWSDSHWTWKLGLVRLVCSGSASEVVSRGWQRNAPALALTDRLPVDPHLDLASLYATSCQELIRADPNAVTGLLNDLMKQRQTKDALKDNMGPEDFRQVLRRTAGRPGLLRQYREDAGRLITQYPDFHLPYRVLHLVGGPIATTSGLAWQIVNASYTEAAYQQKTYEEGPASEILTPGQIPLRLESLVILQGEPSNGPLSSLLDEDQAQDMHAFATILVAAGASAVLVVPPLPFAWTASVVQAIARSLDNTHPPDEHRLLKMVRSTRSTIQRFEVLSPKESEKSLKLADGPYGTREEQVRLALQVCLFLRSKKQPGELLKES
jgi:hypothetical protein